MHENYFLIIYFSMQQTYMMCMKRDCFVLLQRKFVWRGACAFVFSCFCRKNKKWHDPIGWILKK